MPQDIKKIGRVTTESVHKCTGKHWDDWIALLEKVGARNWAHPEIVAWLRKRYKLGPWWEQGVTTGYEMHLGRKVEGRNARGEYSLTATGALPLSQKKMWAFLISPEGQAIWLKPLAPIRVRPGAVFETDGGVFGEVRTLRVGERLRLRWQDTDWAKHSVVQVSIVKRAGEKSILAFQHEGLPDARISQNLRAHWKAVLAELKSHLVGAAKTDGRKRTTTR